MQCTIHVKYLSMANKVKTHNKAFEFVRFALRTRLTAARPLNLNVMQMNSLIIIFIISMLLPYSVYGCSEGDVYHPVEVHLSSLNSPSKGTIKQYLDKRYGVNNWKYDSNKYIELLTYKIPEHHMYVPVTVNFSKFDGVSEVELIEEAKYIHIIATFLVNEQLNEITTRYKRNEKRSKLYAALKKNNKYIITDSKIELFGGHPCAGTVYIE